MTNLFTLLEEQPRPWLDPDQLKAKYHALTALHHPDVARADADFAEINRAYQTLADPVARLRHLIDLHSPSPAPRTQSVPDDIAPFFVPVAEARQSVEAFLKKHAAATSPLAKALLAAEQFQVQERLEETSAALYEKQTALSAQLHDLDTLWQTDQSAALTSLPALSQSLSYTAKWLALLRESVFQLASL